MHNAICTHRHNIVLFLYLYCIVHHFSLIPSCFLVKFCKGFTHVGVSGNPDHNLLGIITRYTIIRLKRYKYNDCDVMFCWLVHRIFFYCLCISQHSFGTVAQCVTQQSEIQDFPVWSIIFVLISSMFRLVSSHYPKKA